MYKIKDYLKYIIPIVTLLLIGGVVTLYYFNFNKKEQKEIVIKDEINLEKEESKKEEIVEDRFFYIDIKGQVNNPGVYKLKENSRIIDVINEAGGLTDNADTSIINLSKKIKDEMFIIIYSKEEIEKYKQDTISTKKINEKLNKEILVIDENNDANINDYNEKQQEKNDENTIININTANKEEFLLLNGIGEGKADAIISYRDENGYFNSIDEIKNVSGIGEALFEKIKDNITV